MSGVSERFKWCEVPDVWCKWLVVPNMETIGRPGDAGAIMVSFFFWMTLTSRNWEEEIKGAWCKGKIPC